MIGLDLKATGGPAVHLDNTGQRGCHYCSSTDQSVVDHVQFHSVPSRQEPLLYFDPDGHVHMHGLYVTDLSRRVTIRGLLAARIAEKKDTARALLVGTATAALAYAVIRRTT